MRRGCGVMCAFCPTPSRSPSSSRLPWPPSCRLTPTSTLSSRIAGAERSHEQSPREELETFPLWDIRLVVVAPRRHVLSRRRKLGFGEALDHEFGGPYGQRAPGFLGPPCGQHWSPLEAARPCQRD